MKKIDSSNLHMMIVKVVFMKKKFITKKNSTE